MKTLISLFVGALLMSGVPSTFAGNHKGDAMVGRGKASATEGVDPRNEAEKQQEARRMPSEEELERERDRELDREREAYEAEAGFPNADGTGESIDRSEEMRERREERREIMEEYRGDREPVDDDGYAREGASGKKPWYKFWE